MKEEEDVVETIQSAEQLLPCLRKFKVFLHCSRVISLLTTLLSKLMFSCFFFFLFFFFKKCPTLRVLACTFASASSKLSLRLYDAESKVQIHSGDMGIKYWCNDVSYHFSWDMIVDILVPNNDIFIKTCRQSEDSPDSLTYQRHCKMLVV